MQYVEILRARRVLFWYAGVLIALLALAALSFVNAHVQVSAGYGHIPLTALLVGSTMASFVIATCVAPGLSCEGVTIAIAWTRPTPRQTIAWRFVAVDVAAILIAFVLSFVAALVFFAMFGALGRIIVDPEWPMTLVLGIGTALMWYALVTLVAARFPGRGGLIAGLSWAVFLVVAGLFGAPLPPLLHVLINSLNYLNPIAYFSGMTAGGEGTVHVNHAIAMSDTGRAILAWCIAAVATAAAVRLWATREA